MPDIFDLRVLATLGWFTSFGSLLVALLGAMVLFGWVMGNVTIVTVLPGLAAMSPLTAICLVAGGFSLFARKHRHPQASLGASLVIFLVCALVLCSYLTHGRDAVDPILERRLDIAGDRLPGLMAPATLSGFILLAVALLSLNRSNSGGRLLTAAAIPGVLLSSLALLGYAYDVNGLYANFLYRTMALHTATGLLVLFLGCLACEPERGWAAILASGLPSGSATRVQLLLATALPFLVGMAVLRFEQAGWIAPGLGLAILVTVTMIPLVFRIFRDGAMLDSLEMKRAAAALAIQALNDELEGMVRHRTASLEASQARFRTYFQYASEGLVLFRLTGEGIFLVQEVNDAFRAIYELQDRDVVNLQPWQFLSQEMADQIVGHLSACARSEDHCRYKVQRVFGAVTKSLDVILAPVPKGASDTERLIVGSVRDNSEAVLREEQLRQAQKMEAVGQLTGGLAHDFNNLLTGISGSLELLSTRIAQGRIGDAPRYIMAAQGASRRAATLTHRLLAFSRRQTLAPRSVDVNRLVGGMEDFVRRTVGPAIEVEIVGAAGLWTALVDPNQLENALLNLCINARDSMPEGGRITIETANKWLDDRAGRERDLPPGQYLSLCVTDTGTGMSPDVATRAFEPFFTTKLLGEGTGLGLSMIYGFVRQSGGQVRIYSEVGQGTTVCLYLPRHDGGPETEYEGAPKEVARALEGETILIVDDEPTIRMLVTDLLAELGYLSLEAGDGPAGLRLVKSDARIDLLITDVGLPGMNGRQMAEAARLARPNLKVLFITGFAENAVFGDGHLHHGMHVLTKPFEMNVLGTKIKELITGT